MLRPLFLQGFYYEKLFCGLFKKRNGNGAGTNMGAYYAAYAGFAQGFGIAFL